MAKDPGDKLKTALKFNISSSPKVFRNQIGGRDRIDLIRIVLQRRSSLNVEMTGLRADANLRLLDRSGKRVLSQSNLPGRQNKSIVVPLDAGTYYVQVTPGRRRDSTRYRLTLSAGNVVPSLTNAGLTLRAGTTSLITNDVLKATESRQQPGALVYTLTSLPQNGSLLLGGVALGAGGRFTQTDIDSGRLSYVSSPSVTRVTDNSANDALTGISGSNLIWNSFEGSQNQQTVKAFFYNGQANKTVQLTAPGVVNAAAQGVSGSDVVWLGSNGTTTQVYLYKDATGTSSQLSTDGRSATNAFIAGSNIAWSSNDGQSLKTFFYNGQTGQTTELTAPGVLVASAFAVSESRTVWLGSGLGANNSSTFDLFLTDLSTGTSTPIPRDGLIEYEAGLSGANAVWNSVTADGQTRKSFFYNGSTGQITELTSPGITQTATGGVSGTNAVWTGGIDANSQTEVFLFNGSTGASIQLTRNGTNDVANGISGSNVVWTGFSGTDGDIFLYDGTANTTTELTNNTENDFGARISGSNIAWMTNDGTDNEIVFRRFAPADQFGFTVADGAGETTNGTFNLTITQG